MVAGLFWLPNARHPEWIKKIACLYPNLENVEFPSIAILFPAIA
jgi:hypothetical protein